MLKAIIFDFNGVILDDEPLHFAAMRDTVADFGIHLTREAYWKNIWPSMTRNAWNPFAGIILSD